MTFGLAGRFQPILRFRRIGFEALAVGIGQVAAAPGAVIGVRVLTEAMSPREYGELALAMTVGTLGLQIFLAPLATAAMRFFAPASEADDLAGFLASVRRLVLQAVVIVATVAIASIAVLFALSKGVWIPLAIGAFLFTIFAGSASVLDGLQNAARHRVIAAAHSGIGPWLRFLAAVWLMKLGSSSSSAAAMAGYALAAAAVLASQVLFFRRSIARNVAAPPLDEQRWRDSMLKYGLPFATWGIFTWAHMASDRWALGAFSNAADVGYYAVVYQLGYYPILMASALIGQVLAPVLFQRAGDGTDPDRVRGAIQLNAGFAAVMALVSVVGCGITVVIHPLIGRLLLADEYRGVTYLLPWMVLAGGLFAVGQVGALFFLITNRSESLTPPKIGSAILGVAMNVAGAWWLGVRGVVGATIAAALFYCIWMMIIALRTYRARTAP